MSGDDSFDILDRLCEQLGASHDGFDIVELAEGVIGKVEDILEHSPYNYTVVIQIEHRTATFILDSEGDIQECRVSHVIPLSDLPRVLKEKQ